MENKGINLMRVDLGTNLQPTLKYKQNKEYIYWGDFNSYPHYLLALFKNSAIHGAIIKGKADAVYGKGLTYSDDLSVVQQAQIQNFLNGGNKFENWDDIFRDTCLQFELFDGFAWQIVWDFGGRIKDVYLMQLAKLRRSPDGSKVFYCEKWVNDDGSVNPSPQKHSSYVEMDIFNPNVRTGKQVYYYKTPTVHDSEWGDLYPEPSYLQCVQDIETDVEITNHGYNSIVNGMHSSSIVTLFNGEPEQREKKKIAEQFKRSHTGSNNAGKVILNFAMKDANPAQVTPLTPADLYQQFDQLSKRVQQNIFTGHNADPEIFGIMVEGTLGNTSGDAILVKWDKFLKAYIEHRQKIILDQIKYIGELSGVDLSGLEVKQKTPITVDIPLENSTLMGYLNRETIINYIEKKYDIDIIEPEIEGVEGMVNEHVKNLTGRQWQNIQRIQRNLQKGKISRGQAEMLLKSGYGLSEGDIKTLLGEQFSNDKEAFALHLFEKYAIDDNDDEIVSEELVSHQFENPYETSIRALTKGVMDLIKGDPMITTEKIAKALQVEQAKIEEVLIELQTKEYISILEGVFKPTEKGLNWEIPEVVTETYTVYAYVTRDDVPRAKMSRTFCQKLMKMSRDGKRWTREGIDRISNEFGNNAWTYRGGYYTNPSTKQTTPYCRHAWKAIVKTRRKK